MVYLLFAGRDRGPSTHQFGQKLDATFIHCNSMSEVANKFVEVIRARPLLSHETNGRDRVPL